MLNKTKMQSKLLAEIAFLQKQGMAAIFLEIAGAGIDCWITLLTDV